jgi:sugar lactone lactonase YvrE
MELMTMRVTSCLRLSLILFAVSGLPAAEVTTLAGTGENRYFGDGGPAQEAGVGGPFGVAIGPDGALYVCETTSHVIRRIDLETGTATTVVGTGTAGNAGDGGLATRAQITEPYEVRFAANGDLYFVDMVAAVVRKVDSQSNIITTVAGCGEVGYSGDGGPATAAKLDRPHSIAFDGDGNLYVCDIGNHRVRIVEASSGLIRTFAGNGERSATPDGVPLEGTPLNGPRALDFDGDRSLYLALREGNSLYRIDLETRSLHHIAGTGEAGYDGDGGPALHAKLSGPKGVSVAPNGDIYLVDTESHTIRVVYAATGFIDTVVGDGTPGDGPDGDPRQCRLNRPHGVFVDAAGTVYIGDSNNNRVRALTP